MTSEDRTAKIDALLHERAGYVMRGKLDRADACTESLRRLGFTPPDSVEVKPKERRPRRRAETR